MCSGAALLGNGGRDDHQIVKVRFRTSGAAGRVSSTRTTPPSERYRRLPAGAAMAGVTHADRLARLEHVQSLHAKLLRAILAELPPPARARVLARFTAAAGRLPVADDDADAAGAAFCAEVLGDWPA